MKKRILAILITALVLASACSKKPAEERRILVVVSETGSVSAADNGQWIYPGQTARFTLSVAPGYAVTGTDYAGTSRIFRRDGKTILELDNVQYPLHVTVTAVSMYRTINYDANGGETLSNISTEKTYNISTHKRPNTETGQKMFKRSGYTLTAWNTKPDGSGDRIGLGSRVTVPESGLTLYAVWEKQTDISMFSFEQDSDSITLTGYSGEDIKKLDPALNAGSAVSASPATRVVIPDYVEGKPVTTIKSGAFSCKDIYCRDNRSHFLRH